MPLHGSEIQRQEGVLGEVGVGLWSGCGAGVWLLPESSVGRKLL